MGILFHSLAALFENKEALKICAIKFSFKFMHYRIYMVRPTKTLCDINIYLANFAHKFAQVSCSRYI